MILTVLDANFRSVYLLDTCESIIWTDRCFECGDFEYHTAASAKLLNIFLNNSYLVLNGSNRLMVIEGIELTSDADDGNKLKITGRSIESILDRRIIWNKSKGEGSIESCIKTLMNENIISPADPNRKIPNLIFRDSTDPRIKDISLKYDCYGENLYEFITTVCKNKKVGFQMILENSTLVFELFIGVDRSYDQSSNPYVIFSPKMENIVNSNYVKSTENSKNTVLVSIEKNEQIKALTVTRDDKEHVGYDRTEHFMTGDSEVTEDVNKEKAKDELTQYAGEELFEGEVDASRTYVYGKDFFIGDIVQIANEYGMASKTRVTEFIYSESDSGIEAYPAFEVIK